MRTLHICLIAFSVFTLLGCGSSGEEELREWMANERAQARPRITPLSEPKQFKPEAYAVEAAVEPFNPMKLTQALRREAAQIASNAALIAPEMARRKETL